jgi:uncharacterized membrane protein
VSTNRLEAFSDGVLAVAITLLVLDIRVPDPLQTPHLVTALGHMWPTYVAYATSFVTIGIIWINHHVMISRLRRADHVILTLNLLLLLTIGVIPFATSLMAEWLRESHGQHLAAAIYAGAFLLMSIAFATLNRHILFAKPHFLRAQLSAERRRYILTRGIAGLVPYAIAVAVAAVSSYATLAICGAVAVFYALPIGSGGGVGAE